MNMRFFFLFYRYGYNMAELIFLNLFYTPKVEHVNHSFSN